MLSHKAKRELKIDQRQVLIDSLEIGLASPQQILMWGERQLPNGKKVGLVQNAKTVNYKKFTPFPDGLFCERIFGPVTSFVCACGKKQAKADLSFCEKCEVEYIDQRARRYRLGYIGLLSPVTHIWYLKGRPSYLSLFLGKRKKAVVEIAYCNAYLVEHGIKTDANKVCIENSVKADSLYTNQAQATIQFRSIVNVTKKQHKTKCLPKSETPALWLPKKGRVFAKNIKVLRNKLNSNFCFVKALFYAHDISTKLRSSYTRMSEATSLSFPILPKRVKLQDNTKSIRTSFETPAMCMQTRFASSSSAPPVKAHQNRNKHMRGCKNIVENTTALKQLLKTQTKCLSNFTASKQTTDPNFTEQDRELKHFVLPKWKFERGVSFGKNSCFVNNVSLQNKVLYKQESVMQPLLQRWGHSNCLALQRNNLFQIQKERLQKSEIPAESFDEFKDNVDSKTGLLGCEKELYTRQQTLPFLPTLVCDFSMRDSLINLFNSSSASADIPLVPYCSIKRWVPLRNVHRFMAERSVENLTKTDLSDQKKATNNLYHQVVSTGLQQNFDTTRLSHKTMTSGRIVYPFKKNCSSLHSCNVDYTFCFRKNSLFLNKSKVQWLAKENKMFVNGKNQVEQDINLSLNDSSSCFVKKQFSCFVKETVEKPRTLCLNLLHTSSFQNKTLLQQKILTRESKIHKAMKRKSVELPSSAGKTHFVRKICLNSVPSVVVPQGVALLPLNKNKGETNTNLVKQNNASLASFQNYDTKGEFAHLNKKNLSPNTIVTQPYANKVCIELSGTNHNDTIVSTTGSLGLKQRSTKRKVHNINNWRFGTLSKASLLRYRGNMASQALARLFYYQQSRNCYLDKSSTINQELTPENNENRQNHHDSVDEYDTIRSSAWLEGAAIREILSYTGGGALKQLLQRFNTHSLEKFISAEIDIARYYHRKKSKFAFNLELDFDTEFYLDEKLRNERDHWASTANLSPSLTDLETDTYLNRIETIENKDRLSTNSSEFVLKETDNLPKLTTKAVTASKKQQDKSTGVTVPKPELLLQNKQDPDPSKTVSFTNLNVPAQLESFPCALKLSSKDLDHKCVLLASRRIYKNSRRLKVVKLFTRNNRRPEWMVLSFLPVLPPDLRPILQMSENMVVASDLNNLYQRVIYRNNRHYRLRLIDFSLVTSIQRLVQDAVDRLIENGKGGSKPYYTPNGRPLKSLSDTLKGKKGRFRLNLLGKRVDFSGRSVIVVSPGCKIHECGLPKDIALELYQYFVIRELMLKKHCSSIVLAKQMIKQQSNLIWDMLRELVYNHPILLNRAPTLHRLGIQAFQPKLVLGNAILLHPLVCSAFNADFDGDQMGIHLPISFSARAESWDLLWSRNNLLSPATGQPILVPSQDMVLGFYYITALCSSFYNSFSLSDPLKISVQNSKKLLNKKLLKLEQNVLRKHLFYSIEEILAFFQNNKICLHTPLWLKWTKKIESDEQSQTPLEVRINSFGLNKHIYLKQKHSSNFTKKQFVGLRNNAFVIPTKNSDLRAVKANKVQSLGVLLKQESHTQTNSSSDLQNSFSILFNQKTYYVRTTVGRVLVNNILQ